jgi:hypothetical protein
LLISAAGVCHAVGMSLKRQTSLCRVNVFQNCPPGKHKLTSQTRRLQITDVTGKLMYVTILYIIYVNMMSR